jgi:hypothetical protein
MGLDYPPVGEGEAAMKVNVYVKMRHAMYASSSVEEVRVVESESVEALNLDLDDDWREFPNIEVFDWREGVVYG